MKSIDTLQLLLVIVNAIFLGFSIARLLIRR